MRKILAIFLLVMGFVSCENETKTSDPGIFAMANNEEFTTGVKFEDWRPDYFRASVNSDNILSLIADTDSTRFVLRVPYTVFSNDADKVLYLGDVGKLGVREGGVEGLAGYAQYQIMDGIDKKVLGRYATYDSNTVIKDTVKGIVHSIIENPGIVVFDKEEDQIPGTISGTFYANLQKEIMNEEDEKRLTPKQLLRVEKLRNSKSFQDGVFFRIPVEPAK